MVSSIKTGYSIVLAMLLAAPMASATAAETAAEPAKAVAKSASKPEYLRLTRDDKHRGTALETAITRFAPLAEKGATAPTVTVDLVAAVHIGEKSYYEKLNHEFKDYDAVLYELVASAEGTKIPKGGRKGGDTNIISSLQNGMKDILDLEFQLNRIDYTAKNMVHADMSPDQFTKSMHDRGEGMSDIFFRMFKYAMSKEAEGNSDVSDVDLLMALMDKDRSLALKRIMAEQFADIGGSLDALEGPQGSTLVSERNKTALAVLRKEMAAGKHKIAIFYGAAHMSDFEKRLRSDFKMAPVSTRWFVAWDLKEPPKTASKQPAK